MKKIKIDEKIKEAVLKDLTEQVTKAKTLAELEEIKVVKDKTNFNNIKKPEIFIPADVMEKMHALVKASSTECQWHGLVQRSEKIPNMFYIYDVLVFPQKNTAASTDSDENKYAEWLMNIMTDEDETKFNNLRLHGHSHVNMEVYSSSIDDKYQNDILSNIKDDDYYIFFVLNKRREICILLYDFSQNILFDTKDIKLHITSNEKTIDDWAKEQLDTFVEKPSYFYQKFDNFYSYEDDYYGIANYSYSAPKKEKKKKRNIPKIERRY